MSESLTRVQWEFKAIETSKPKKLERLLEDGWEPFNAAPIPPEGTFDVVYLRRIKMVSWDSE